MRFADLERTLATTSPTGLWFLHGEEELSMLEAADTLRAAARKAGFTERDVFQALPGVDWSDLPTLCQSMSLFGDKKIVEVRLMGNKPSQKGAELLTDMPNWPMDDLLVIVSAFSDWQVQKTAWFKSLSTKAHVVECPAVTGKELPSWFQTRLAHYQLSATQEALNLLSERCEGNLLAARQEVLKLAYRLKAGDTITAEDIADNVSDVAHFDTDNLLSAIATGDAAKALKILNNLQVQGEVIPSFLWLLTDEISTAIKYRSLIDDGQRPDQAARTAAIYGDKRTRINQLTRRLSANFLAAILGRLADVDKISKGLILEDRNHDAWIELASVIGTLASTNAT